MRPVWLRTLLLSTLAHAAMVWLLAAGGPDEAPAALGGPVQVTFSDPAQAPQEPARTPPVPPMHAQPDPLPKRTRTRRRAAVQPPTQPPLDRPQAERTPPTDRAGSIPQPAVRDRYGSWTYAPQVSPATPTEPNAAALIDADTRSWEEAASQGLTEALTLAANARPHVSRRPPPRLREHPDGSFTYAHHAFHATIAEDGSVRFGSGTQNGLQPSFPITFTFDLTDAVLEEPYLYEKQWFLDETQGLRDRLARNFRTQLQAQGVVRMRARLYRLWRDGTKPAVERRRAIFELWAECAPGPSGAPGRQAIERFVRAVLPATSRVAFSPEELRRLNRPNPGPGFSPYAQEAN